MTDRPYSHFAVDRLLPQYWRVPSIIGRSTRSLLRRSQSCPRLVESIEDDDNLTVVVFTSRNPEFFLAPLRHGARSGEDRHNAARPDRNAALA